MPRGNQHITPRHADMSLFFLPFICICLSLNLPWAAFPANILNSSFALILIDRVMKVPEGFLATLWSFLSFLPFFLLLFILGLVKAVILSPFAAGIIFIGNSCVIVGLWPAHFIWSYCCVIKTQRLGLVLKILLLLSLPIPLLLWPIIGIVGSLVVGVVYGFFTPLIATFEAVGEHVIDKFVHCFTDGCWSTIKGSCTIVRDFTDICFHSYFSYMDELSEKFAEDETPLDIKLSKLPRSLLVSLLAMPIDVAIITAIALWKSPCMLLRGWQRLFHDLIGREGPFLETVFVPFAGLAIILWPLAVVGSVISAFVSSFFLGLYTGVIAYQEDSLKMGLASIISVISMFDEYTNDLLYLREGSCFPRLVYRRNMDSSSGLLERNQSIKTEKEELTGEAGPSSTKLFSEQSRTLRKAIQQLKPTQLWDWLFRSCELNSRILLREGLITVEDIEECVVKGKSNKLIIMLPAYCILQCLLRSANSDSPGLLITDEVELTTINWPKDKVFEWFLGPLLIMKEQIKQLQLDENEQACLCKLIMIGKNQKPEDWNGIFPSDDTVRRAQLQAILRRLQGIVASMSRLPTFRRRFRNLVKLLYIEAMETYGVASQGGGSSKFKGFKSKSMNLDEKLYPELGSKLERKSRSINWAEKQNDEAAEIKVEVRHFEGVYIA